MIDQDTSASPGAPGPAGGPPPEGLESPAIGAFLRRQRILRGMSTEELASLTRIPLRSLERLEGGEFDGETDGFVRGFVRTVAKALGLDADDAIARMLQEPSPSAWERHAPVRSMKRGLAGLLVVVVLAVTFLVLRAGWTILSGAAESAPEREVVLWQDPVRALAEATGARLDSNGKIAPEAPAERPTERPAEAAPGAPIDSASRAAR